MRSSSPSALACSNINRFATDPGKIMMQVYHVSKAKNLFLRQWHRSRTSQLNYTLPALALFGRKNRRRQVRSNDINKEFSSYEPLLTSGEVPKGFLAVYVGPELRRFVIPMSYLSMPEFVVLMDKAAEEFGYEQEGGLQIPCEEQDFEKILLSCVAKEQTCKSKKKKQ